MAANVSSSDITLKPSNLRCQISICDQEQVFHKSSATGSQENNKVTYWTLKLLSQVSVYYGSYKLECNMTCPVCLFPGSQFIISGTSFVCMSIKVSCVSYIYLKRWGCLHVVKGCFFLAPAI